MKVFNIKRISKILLLAATTSFIYSCEESGADGLIDFSEKREESAKDTSYVAKDSTATAQEKAVLIEDFTGNNCSNCPDAAKKIKELKADYGERVISMAIHAGSDNFTKPYHGYSKYDFTTTSGTNIYELFGGGSLPIGAVDRKLYSGESKINHDRSKWRLHTEEQLALENPVNIDIRLDSINEDKMNFRVKLFYNQAVADDHYLAVYITQDSIIDHQTSGIEHIKDYHHEHVYRASVLSYNGDLIDEPLDKGRVIVKYLEVPIEKGSPDDEYIKYWDYKHLNIVAVVHKRTNNDFEVVHVQEIKAKL